MLILQSVSRHYYKVANWTLIQVNIPVVRNLNYYPVYIDAPTGVSGSRQVGRNCSASLIRKPVTD